MVNLANGQVNKEHPPLAGSAYLALLSHGLGQSSKYSVPKTGVVIRSYYLCFRVDAASYTGFSLLVNNLECLMMTYDNDS